MSLFKRVNETLQTPEYLIEALGDEQKVDNYSYLKKTAATRKHVMAQKQAENYAVEKTPYSWEQEKSQEEYQDFKFPNSAEAYEELDFATNHRAIRRASSGVDNGMSARSTENDLQIFTPEQYMTAMLRGASIFEPDMANIRDAFMESQENQTEAAMENIEIARERRALAHNQWENERLNAMQDGHYALSRANKIIRSGIENVAAGRNGLIDWNELEDRERQKLQMRENRRIAQQEIKRKGYTREQMHNEWENNLDLYARTLDQVYSVTHVDDLIIE